jgi:dihydrofolate reductase
MTAGRGRVRVFVAMSLDGFIAGPDDDLSWLPQIPDDETPDPGVLTWDGLMNEVGALLMGRRTYEVVRGFDVPWPYTSQRVVVASRRPLDDDPPEGVEVAAGTIGELVERARTVAGGRDVYLDGGTLIGQACSARLVDELVITVIPVVLGRGRPLFPGVEARRSFELTGSLSHPGGLAQLRMVRPDP